MTAALAVRFTALAMTTAGIFNAPYSPTIYTHHLEVVGN